MNINVLDIWSHSLPSPLSPGILFPELMNRRLDLFVTFFHFLNNNVSGKACKHSSHSFRQAQMKYMKSLAWDSQRSRLGWKDSKLGWEHSGEKLPVQRHPLLSYHAAAQPAQYKLISRG